MAGRAHGPDVTVLGKDAVTETLAQILCSIPKRSPQDLSVNFFIETEGSLSDIRVKSGPGRRAYYDDIQLASVTIGITMGDLRLPLADHVDLVARHVLNGYEHLAPFLKKKGVEFDEEGMREKLQDAVGTFREIRELEEHPSDEVVRRFLEKRHPDLVRRIQEYSKD